MVRCGGDFLHNCSCSRKAERAGYEAGGAIAAVAVESEVAGVSGPRAHRAVVLRIDNRLSRHDAVDAEWFVAARETVPPPKLAADFLQQPVVTRECEVDYFESGRSAPSTGRSGGHDEKVFSRHAASSHAFREGLSMASRTASNFVWSISSELDFRKNA